MQMVKTAASWLGMLCMMQLLAPASLRAASVGMAPVASGCSAPLTLTLRPGLTEPNNHVSMPAARNIPPGPVVIHVPLYPAATPSSLPMPHAAYSYPASEYLKAVTAEYAVSVDWITASNWYRQAFLACGYAEAGSSSSGVHGVTVSIGLAMRDPRHPPLEVALAFTHGPAGKTLVLYVAYTIALPPQPTMVPGTPRSVEILAYRPLVPGQLAASRPNKFVIVRDSPSIRDLIRHLNALPPPGGVMSCPSDNGSHDELIFRYPDGHHVTVDVGVRGCRIVWSGKKVGFAGADNGLFRLLASLLARKTAVHLGAPFEARSAVGAHAVSAYTSQIRSHGVMLSVSLARRTYPQDALVRVTVRLVNVSQRTVQIGGTGAAVCYQQGPGIRVTDSAKQTLYPPAVNWLFASCGPPIIPRPLLPGHVIQARLLAVLRGNHIQAVARIGANSLEITTPPLSLRLVPEPAPRAVVHPDFLAHVDVAPATPGQQGRFYYVESEACLAATPDAPGAVGSAAGIGRFQFTRPDQDGVYRFSTICGSPTFWNFTGGWLNHRAVSVKYIRPKQAAP